MSAFLCSARLLSILVNAPAHFAKYPSDAADFIRRQATAAAPDLPTSPHAAPRHTTADVAISQEEAIFSMLLTENLASVNHRYSHIEDAEWGEQGYIYDPKAKPDSLAHAMKAAACYDYQSCEHDGWETSNARAYIRELVFFLAGYVDGWDAAPWGQ